MYVRKVKMKKCRWSRFVSHGSTLLVKAKVVSFTFSHPSLGDQRRLASVYTHNITVLLLSFPFANVLGVCLKVKVKVSRSPTRAMQNVVLFGISWLVFSLFCFQRCQLVGSVFNLAGYGLPVSCGFLCVEEGCSRFQCLVSIE